MDAHVYVGYAIVSIDLEATSEEERVGVRRIVWDEDSADQEVRRLYNADADKNFLYFWQHTRVDRRQSVSLT